MTLWARCRTAEAALALLVPCVVAWLVDAARPVRCVLVHARNSATAAVAVAAGVAEPWRPTWWLSGPLVAGFLQTLAFGLSIGAPAVGDFELESWTAADGGQLALAWPSCGAEAGAAVALILPGLGGSVTSSGYAVAACRAAGLRPCVLHRRGDAGPLASACFSLFGHAADLRDGVARARARHPRSAALVLLGSSAGTGLLVRYLGEEGERAPVAAAFANCPGFDISVALTRFNALLDRGHFVCLIKRKYLSAPGTRALLEARDTRALERCERARSLHELLVAASPFAGFGPTFGEYLLACNPMGVAHRITVPALVLTADDDPVCVAANVDDHVALFERNENFVLARAPRGGHCAFLCGPRADRHWGFEIGVRFLKHYADTAMAQSGAR